MRNDFEFFDRIALHSALNTAIARVTTVYGYDERFLGTSFSVSVQRFKLPSEQLGAQFIYRLTDDLFRKP
jgi:hypothetical protein